VSDLHLVLPNDIDDPASPSGGNTYDRRISTGLASLGWVIHEHPAVGDWPHPESSTTAALARKLDSLPNGALVLLDGLVASAVPEALDPHADRLRLVVLVHMPTFHPYERRAFATARALIVPSEWARAELLRRYPLASGAVHVVYPGADPAPLAHGTPFGGGLVCVAAVSLHKGHDRVIDALAQTSDLR